MKAHCLYKIETPHEYYLYVLQMKNYDDTMNILAIRSDFVEAVMPLYSTGIKYKEDLGYPTVETLINISNSFYNAVKTAIVCCNLTFKGNALREHVGSFLREKVEALCYTNISNIERGRPISANIKKQHKIFAAINRTLSHREVIAYVQDKINT